jgi:Mg-chelatase subunit ChlD
VLFLFDVSTSMGDDRKAGLAVRAVRRALEVLGPKDAYGLLLYPPPKGDQAKARAVVPIGVHDTAASLGELDRIRSGALVDRRAWMYEPLAAAVQELRQDSTKQTRTVVLVTDGDDKDRGGDGRRDQVALLEALGAGPGIPVLTLAMRENGCDDAVGVAISSASGGECVPAGPEAADRLAALIASVGAGGDTAKR